MGNMGELFGVIRQVAGDTRGHLMHSLPVPSDEPLWLEDDVISESNHSID